MEKRKSISLSRAEREEEVGGAAPPEALRPDAPDAQWLDFGVLRMADAQSSARGTLERVEESVAPTYVPLLQRAIASSHAQRQGVMARAQLAALRDRAGHFDDRFDAARAVSVPSDGQPHTVPLFEADVRVTPEWVCVPAVETKVFRTVTLENRSAHALLSGPLDVRLGGAFLMSARLPTLAPGGKERVGLGVEEAVQVSRNTRFHEAVQGLLGGATVLDHGIEVEVANRLAAAVTLRVRERVPVSQDKDVRVEEPPQTPPWVQDTGYDLGEPVEGARAWLVTLGPGETKTLKAAYQIKLPSNRMLAGGNRRS